MFDHTALKAMKLSELQEIAKLSQSIKFNGVKKEVLIEQILAHQEATSRESAVPSVETPKEGKTKRTRMTKSDAYSEVVVPSQDLFSETPNSEASEITPVSKDTVSSAKKPEKFKKKAKSNDSNVSKENHVSESVSTPKELET
ncbi:MAG: hypothetical protein RL622_234, partial [Actinomycetota bacterium]